MRLLVFDSIGKIMLNENYHWLKKNSIKSITYFLEIIFCKIFLENNFILCHDYAK